MKNVVYIAALIFLPMKSWCQEKVDSSYANSYYKARLAYFQKLPDRKNEIVFLGNSITEAGEWQEVITGETVANRGISGDNSWGVLNRLDEVLASKPKKIFLTIGVNDLKRGTPEIYIARTIKRIIAEIRMRSPQTSVYVQSVLPVHEPMLAAIYDKIKNSRINNLNKLIAETATGKKVVFVNLHNDHFLDANGQLKKELSTDGLHLQPAAYIVWVQYLKQMKYL